MSQQVDKAMRQEQKVQRNSRLLRTHFRGSMDPVSTCRVQPCPVEDVYVRKPTLRRKYSVDAATRCTGFSSFEQGLHKSLCWHVYCSDTVKDPHDHVRSSSRRRDSNELSLN
ncbi:hypothetical protein RGR602_PB00170 (plasmid) [Rhizobium gallicum bv. gallicum R602sp]|uniref:Uncharacterized protein n=1 Tax=Rhizobium gallicum bv. gallicum R602sp TaxID=1041138 RepID=A0A0B4XAR4_9HYPH|nr:hypothetical protein RGR602_PB00170 [Rhizobium gallicum bv. gallicum R602sp]